MTSKSNGRISFYVTNHNLQRFRVDAGNKLFWSSIDSTLNITIFIWYGAAAPWSLFIVNNILSPSRLVALAVLILLLQRLPVILMLRTKITEIENFRQALFVGIFGPIGVSAIFYLFVGLDFLESIVADKNGVVDTEIQILQEALRVVVWFLVVSSVVVHGLAVPVINVFGNIVPKYCRTGAMHRCIKSCDSAYMVRPQVYLSLLFQPKEELERGSLEAGYGTMREGQT